MSNNVLINNDIDILIVEDEIILAMALEIKLKKMGFNVSGISTSPNKAISHVQNHFPDIVIVDINLNSTKTGIDVANYIWKNFNIPIIFLTSYYNDNILKKAMESEPYAYLIKPCRASEIKVAINTVIHKHRYFFKEMNTATPIKNKILLISESLKFDREKSELYFKNKVFKLSKNEIKLFNLLTKEAGEIISFTTIFSYIWREDVYDLSKLRSMIYRLKIRLGENPFENLYEAGYKVKKLENIL